MNRKTAERLMKNPHYKLSKKEEVAMFGGLPPTIHTGELKVPEVKIVRAKRKYVRKAKKQESDKSESEQNNS